MEASQPEVVTLVSAEGAEFRVRRPAELSRSARLQRSPPQTLQIDKRAACMSKAINNMLAPDSASQQAAATGRQRLTHSPCRRFPGGPVRQGEV